MRRSQWPRAYLKMKCMACNGTPKSWTFDRNLQKWTKILSLPRKHLKTYKERKVVKSDQKFIEIHAKTKYKTEPSVRQSVKIGWKQKSWEIHHKTSKVATEVLYFAIPFVDIFYFFTCIITDIIVYSGIAKVFPFSQLSPLVLFFSVMMREICCVKIVTIM